MLARFEEQVNKYNHVLEKSMQMKMAMQGVLLDEMMQARAQQFMRYVMVFMLRTASGTDYVPGKPFK